MDECLLCMNITMLKLLREEELEKILGYPEEIASEVLLQMQIEFNRIIETYFNGLIPDNIEDYKEVFDFNLEFVCAS